jgi:hypothetical protein
MSLLSITQKLNILGNEKWGKVGVRTQLTPSSHFVTSVAVISQD